MALTSQYSWLHYRMLSKQAYTKLSSESTTEIRGRLKRIWQGTVEWATTITIPSCSLLFKHIPSFCIFCAFASAFLLETPFCHYAYWNYIHPSQFGLKCYLLLANYSNSQIENNHILFWLITACFWPLILIFFISPWCSRSVTAIHFMGHNLIQICKSFPLFSWVNNMQFHKVQFYHFLVTFWLSLKGLLEVGISKSILEFKSFSKARIWIQKIRLQNYCT